MPSGNEAGTRRLPERRRAGAVLEIAACLLLFGAGLSTLGRYVVWMGSTSLWTDELHTIIHYSGLGPMAVLTQYREPNNHIFFNLVNSLTPGRRSVEPLRARSWSFLAFFATLGIGATFFIRRGALLAGALLFGLLAVQPELLDLVLQARGYAFLCLFGLLAAILFVRFLDDARRRDLLALALVSVAGTWTVPTFGFFITPLWLLTVVTSRRRDTLVGALATGCGILAAYAPVASQLLHQLRHYDEKWGRQYARLSAVGETIGTYLLHPSLTGFSLGNMSWLVVSVSLCALVFLAFRRNRSSALSGALLLVAVALFFGTCLVLQTPLIRSTAFVVVPLAFTALYLLWTAAPVPGLAGRALFLLVATVVAIQAGRHLAGFHFLPSEQWQELARTLHDTVPEGTKFHVTEKADFLSGYLPPGYAAAPDIQAPQFARGEELYLDTPVVEPPEGRIDPRTEAPDAVEFRIPQRRARYQALWMCPPTRSFLIAFRTVDGSFLAKVTDRNLATDTGVIGPADSARSWAEIELEKGRRYRSLVLVFADGSEACPSVLAFGGRSEPVLPGPVRCSRNVVLVNLADQPVALVTLLGHATSQTLPPVEEAWAFSTPSISTRR